MKLASRFDGPQGISSISTTTTATTTTLYAKCARALETVRAENGAAYDATFGAASAVAAAAKMHALRYASPNDPRRAMEYGPDPVVSVVACLFDETELTATVPPRLIDGAVIGTVEELEPIVRGAQTLLAAQK